MPGHGGGNPYHSKANGQFTTAAGAGAPGQHTAGEHGSHADGAKSETHAVNDHASQSSGKSLADKLHDHVREHGTTSLRDLAAAHGVRKTDVQEAARSLSRGGQHAIVSGKSGESKLKFYPEGRAK